MADDTPPTKSLEDAPAKPPTTSLEDAPARRTIPYERTFSETFDVLVGREHDQQLFTVHYDVITIRSRFFRQARSPQWNSDKSLPVELQHVDPQIFDMYLQCVYHNEVPDFTGEEYTEAQLRYEVLLDLYVLADSLLDFTTTKLAMNAIWDIHYEGDLPEAGMISHAYRHTMEGCALREVLVEMYSEASWLPDGDFPNEFLRAIVEKQVYYRHGE
jgi:hypothetical protein